MKQILVNDVSLTHDMVGSIIIKEREFLGIRCTFMQPNKQFRPAIWECMLGTVYAMNDDGECRYYDYDHASAIIFAGIKDEPNLRLYPRQNCNVRFIRSGITETEPYKGNVVLWKLIPKLKSKVKYGS